MSRDIVWLTATEIIEAVRKGQTEPQDVLGATLDRARRLNAKLHAYTYIDETARAGRGPWAGVTIAVKDSLPVKGMPWTYGSPKWRNRIADHSAPSVTRACAEGATALGKLNLPELAAAVGTSNKLFPDTQNPWRHGVTPGGSSGGSAAAVAAGICTVALGTDMGGSIRIPAACCGSFGLRPSKNRIPDDQPDLARLSVVGPLTRSVADLRILFQALANEAPLAVQDRRYRVAVASDSVLGVDAPCAAACQKAGLTLSQLGHELHSIPWDPRPAIDAYRILRPVTMGDHPGPAEEYGEAVRPAIVAGRATTGSDFDEALSAGTKVGRQIRELFERFDFLLTPTLGMLPMPIGKVPQFLGQGWDRYTQFVLPVSFSELPAIAMPAGLDHGLPVSVQLVGPPRAEWQLFRLAEELERHGFAFQRPPDLD